MDKKMARKKKYTIKEAKEMKEKVLKMLKENLGILTPVLQTYGIPTGVYYRWLDEDDDFRKNVSDIKEISLDFVESKLLKLIRDEDKTAIIFYLKCKGKERGYVEVQRIEQETSFKEPLRINVVPPDEQYKIEGPDIKQIP